MTDMKPPRSAAEWDALYGSVSEFFSGAPNPSLIDEAGALPPGRALDVGCGEGADAVWLARRGWEVTGLDVSQVALDRAAARAATAGVQVSWVHAGVVEAALPPDSFDLVCAQYPALHSSAGRDSERALVDLVAPGGRLLMVYHAGFDGKAAKARGIDPADYVQPADMVTVLLGGDWHISIDTLRPRKAPADDAEHHFSHDVILRAQRTAENASTAT